MFDSNLENWTCAKYKIGFQPYHTKPFPIPKVHEETLKT